MKRTQLFVLLGMMFTVWFFRRPPPDGPVEEYYDNGQLYEKGSYKDGEPCGEWFEGETFTYDPC